MIRALTAAPTRPLFVCAPLLLVGCFDSPAEPTEVVIDLTIRGTVVVEPGGGPVPGATVDYGVGGYFSLPLVQSSDVTDGEGRYEIRHELRYTEPCPFQWVQASAEGFLPTRGIEDRRVSVGCVESVQVIDIPLAPSS